MRLNVKTIVKKINKEFRLILFLLVPLLAISLFITLSLTNAAATVTFGTTTVGVNTDTGNSNSITCNKYSSSTGGTLQSLSVRVGNIDKASKNYSLAIYADANGSPTTKLGSGVGTLTANAWNTITISAPITSNTPYWLCYNSSTTKSAYNNMKSTNGTTPAIYKVQSYGTWPATFGTVGASWTGTYSLYATVTVDNTPTSTPIPTPTSASTPTVSPTQPTTTIPFAIGTTSIGNTTDTGNGNGITCNKYSSPNTGTISSMSVAIGAIDTASKNYSLAMYADSNGTPTTRLASATGVLTANTWNTLSLSTLVSTGSNYWLCYNTSTTNSAYSNMKGSNGTTPAIYKYQSYGTWPATFGTVGGSWTGTYSIYATGATASSTTPTPTSAATSTPTPVVTGTPIPTSVGINGALMSMGDSYSSAWGAPPYVSPREDCDHSISTSYVYVAKNLLGSGVTAQGVGCSGAKSQDVQQTFKGEPAQVGRLSGATWVAMTMGGNDYDILGALTQGTTGPNRIVTNATNIKNNVITVINKVKTNVPGVKVYILGYPDLLPTDQATLSQSTCFGSQASSINLSAAHNMYVVINNAIKDAATATGATYVDTAPAFVGHDMCQPTGTNWFVRLNEEAELHPNVAGHQAMGTLLYQAIVATQ